MEPFIFWSWDKGSLAEFFKKFTSDGKKSYFPVLYSMMLILRRCVWGTLLKTVFKKLFAEVNGIVQGWLVPTFLAKL